MKKSVILSIIAIYIVSIFVVGFMGQKLKVYDEIVYVENIYCEAEGFNPNVTQDEKNKDVIGKIERLYTEGMKIQVKCKISPDNATYPTLNYFLEDAPGKYTYEVIDGVAIITVISDFTAYITVTSSDTQRKSVKIKIVVTDIGGII